ncbi:hypothetical protein JG688_00012973 [Phytophthora aleatoria]|uniref:Uncharacterized protein n=1 Tax=Phytophthora aleatoria TaxID=2496075 RepID=A0A8J5MEJ7_9STRA|nr:hypothetical protein JG688_00012973 [Phytophthora aleatoria]
MVSDTTGSARNASNQFEDTNQVDCLMHLLSLCLLYALGMKENTRDNGCRVLQKLRNLTTFANATLRLAELNQLKELYLLPAINISIDSKTRVGYAVTLLRRSVYNHFAFTKYFETAHSNEQTAWQCIRVKIGFLSQNWKP